VLRSAAYALPAALVVAAVAAIGRAPTNRRVAVAALAIALATVASRPPVRVKLAALAILAPHVRA
jgi:hypothetical protein